MGKFAAIVVAVILTVSQVYSGSNEWYKGDDRCPPPKDDGKYSAPYNALEHPTEYPTFYDADRPGWSCSYQRPDGVIVQYGNSLTPQQQWLQVWGGGGDSQGN